MTSLRVSCEGTPFANDRKRRGKSSFLFAQRSIEGAQITVHAAPGMNEAQLTELVARKQDEAQRRAKRRARGRMHDGIGGAY